MNIQEYHKLVDVLFDELSDFYDNVDGVAEVDLDNKFLQVVISQSQIFLLNKNEVSQEIWYSSPVSGGHKFVLDPKSHVWNNSYGDELVSLLKKEVTILTIDN